MSVLEYTTIGPRRDYGWGVEYNLEAAAAAGRSAPAYWDAEAGELACHDPEEAAWYEGEPFDAGWEDPARAAAILDQVLIDDARLTPLAETPVWRPLDRLVDAALVDAPTPEEVLHERRGGYPVLRLDAFADEWAGQEAA
ncbi:hypothetical protein ABZ234_07850 [Nocardiopsis sp. NPDC006198]|uniref:hypothetical protein n=1 Tax=Nocardiopsis sp. NPDC006198 TaxID=3154472 RepID=UPI0033A58001